ncbi:MAG: GatB/YqeY domain-containing protein [Candidatus Paceibacterota bacterium]|jgi:hypothetical protein
MIQQKIKDDLKTAMIAKDAGKTLTLRSIVAAFGNELTTPAHAGKKELTDEEALAIIRRGVKQRKDSIDQFTKGGRSDLVDAEKMELAVLEKYLPSMMSREDIQKIAEAKKTELGITDKKEVGKFMSVLMKELKGKADGADVKAVVEKIFS